MQKLLITAAMIACVTLSAAASAHELDYQIYGVAHVSTDLQNNGADSSLFVSSNNTRFGIRGTYATDYELFTVVFQHENSADFNGERSGLSTRNSFAGLQGDWGRLIWGRHDTPFYSLGRTADLFGDCLGDARSVTGYFGYGWDLRMHSMLMYSTPQLADALKLHVQHVAEEGREDRMFLSASGVYQQGAVTIGLAYELHGKGWETAYSDSLYLADVGEAQDSGAFRAIAVYNAGGLKVAGLFQSISDVAGYDGASATTFGLGASYRLDSGVEPKAQVYVTDPNTDVDDDGATMVGVGLDYHLTKKSRLYLAYATMLNEDDAKFVPFRGGHGKNYGYGAAVSGESPYGISVGLIAGW